MFLTGVVLPEWRIRVMAAKRRAWLILGVIVRLQVLLESFPDTVRLHLQLLDFVIMSLRLFDQY
jgi:hypothetical protein